MSVSGEMVASFSARDPSPCLFHSLTSFFFFQESILLLLTQAMTQRKYSSTTTMTQVEL